MSKLLGVFVLGILTTVGCSNHASFVPTQTAQDSMGSNALRVAKILSTERMLHDTCGGPVAPGRFRCFMTAPRAAFFSVQGNAEPTDASCTLDQPPCYGPLALQSAYKIKQKASSRGKGITVAVVDAYAYPTAESDLKLYRKDFSLPKLCSHCFKILGQTGGTPPPGNGSGSGSQTWDGEQALDVDMVSAICPNCHILLVEAQDNSTANLLQAVSTALKKADIVSLSWGGSEWASSSELFDEHPGKVIIASAGDAGYGAFQPCSFNGVVCVGGTSLTPSNSARGWSEVVWNDNNGLATGSGCSAYVQKPAWQTHKGCRMRAEADISADADPNTGVLLALQGWCCYGGGGGTSVSAPIIAAMFALADNTKTATPAKLWAHGGDKHTFNDVIIGTNGTCSSSYLYMCNARKGYDGPTGWGSPNGVGAL